MNLEVGSTAADYLAAVGGGIAQPDDVAHWSAPAAMPCGFFGRRFAATRNCAHRWRLVVIRVVERFECEGLGLARGLQSRLGQFSCIGFAETLAGAQGPGRRLGTRRRPSAEAQHPEGHGALSRGVLPDRPRSGMPSGGARIRWRSSTARRPNADLILGERQFHGPDRGRATGYRRAPTRAPAAVRGRWGGR
jgi:hypothetical protein